MAWAIVENDQVTRIVNVPTKITANGVSHPKSIFTTWHADDLRAIGIFPYREEPVDNRYYNSGEATYSIGATSVIGTYEGTAKDLDQLKENWINQVKSIAASRLAQTDWMVIRQTEGGTPVPTDISTYRSALRVASNEKETAINALTTIVEAIAYDNEEVTETVDGEEVTRTVSNVTGNWPEDPTVETEE
jgi:hypothetical protein